MSAATPGRLKERLFAALAWLLPAACLAALGTATLGWRFAWVLPAAFAACEWTVRGAAFLVRPGLPVLGMAGGVIDEALARRLPRWMAAVLCAGLGAIAAISQDVRLEYWERSFLDWSLLFIEVAVCVLALALSALAVSAEYRGKQIHSNLTKPVGRFSYLLGKWFGLALLSAAVLTAAAGTVVLCTHAIESRWSAATPLEGEAKMAEIEAAHRTVLSSRFLTTPAMENPEALDAYFLERLETMAAGGGLDANAAVQRMLEEAKTAGRRPTPEMFRPLLSPREFTNCMELATGKWYTLGHPQDSPNTEPSQVYVFSGLLEPLARAQEAKGQVVAQLQAHGLAPDEAEAFVLVLKRRTLEVSPRVKAWANEWLARDPAGYEAATAGWTAALEAHRLQLTLKPHATGTTPRDGAAELRLEANGLPVVPLRASERQALLKAGLPREAVARGHRLLPVGQAVSLDIPAERIDVQGRLAIRLTRVLVGGSQPQPVISFDTANPAAYGVQASAGDIRLYGPAGAFAPNIGAALAVLWIKAGFLAMLGLVCGSLFSFPVACLIAAALYFLVAFSGGLQASFEDFTTLGNKPTGGVDYALMQLKSVTRTVMLAILRLSPDFGAYDAQAQVADGAQVPFAMLGRCAAVLGVAWTGGVLVVGWLLFERREIARVVV